MESPKFLPFYERLTKGLPEHPFGKVLVSVLLGLAFIGVHCASIGNMVFKDWSWFLGALISIAMLCLYYATHTLRTIFPEMDMRLRPLGCKVYITPLGRILSDRNFVLVGLFFGLLNCGFGYCFGIPYTKGSAIITVSVGYFLAGFVCGMAIWGIYGVSVSISAFSQGAKHSFDFTSPDHCGGTLFLGEALVVFSSVTLIVGVMISVYILQVDWARENSWWVKTLKYFWIAFPYLWSLIALIAPAVPMNKALREYKIEQEATLQGHLNEIRKRLEDNQSGAAERKELRENYEFQQSIRKDLHRMRTWPFGLRTNLKYLAVFIANSFASVKSAAEWLRNLPFGSGA